MHKHIQFSNFVVSNSSRMLGQFPQLWNRYPVSIFLVQVESVGMARRFCSMFKLKRFDTQHLYCLEVVKT